MPIPDFINPDLQIVLWSVSGAACLLIGNALRNKYQHLEKNGLKAAGVVIRVVDDSWFTLFDTMSIYRHSIRFVTADQRWITKNHFTLLERHEGCHHEGDTIDILYNPKDPEEFVVDSAAGGFLHYVYLIVGVLSIGYSFWLIFQQLQ